VCGRNFTVALNGIGQVLQMGSTGAVNHAEHQAMWEGARMPVIVGGPLAGARARGARAAGARGPSAFGLQGERERLQAVGQPAPGRMPRARVPSRASAPTRPRHPPPHRCRPGAGMRAEMVAAGESHVLVACTLRGPRSGGYSPQPQPYGPGASWDWGQPGQGADASACRLVAWGRNGHGQLGAALPRDFNVPQFVVGINGRRVLHLAAGGTFSMAVCEHDPREAAARWSM
jgi:hypothetical protein